jgi:tetratricopeptide (TPR) repeat protein
MKNKLLINISLALICLIIIVLIIVFSIDLSKNLETYTSKNIERAKIEHQIKTWKSIVQKYKGYKDGYLQLAILEYRLGKFENSKEDLQTALKLDPNYKEGLELQKKMKNF